MFPDKEAMMAGALEMAEEIAGRSPVAIQGTKINLIYSRDHSVAEGLDYMVRTSTKWTVGGSVSMRLQHCILLGFPGVLEHEHAPDRWRDEVGSGLYAEEESEDDSFLKTLKGKVQI